MRLHHSRLGALADSHECGRQDESGHRSAAYGASVKSGLQFKRRFWEQDDGIYGGISFTNQPNALIGYPNFNFFSKGKGVLQGSQASRLGGLLLSARSPDERI